MAKTKVTNLVRVKQGHNIIEFELVDSKLNILYRPRMADGIKVTLNEEAVDVLTQLLMSERVTERSELTVTTPTKLATELPPDTRREGEHESPNLESPRDFVSGMA